ncbi:MAG: hypothetical protein SGJ27_29490 [Candidatus Melainabacteria bacterium]|nr:hypothetical protein [Candidatus Melainabacteria bacterium]
MSHENFQPNSRTESVTDAPQLQCLNLCDVYEVGRILKNDLSTYGPGMLKSVVTETKPETVVAAAASAALITVAVLAGSEVIIGVAGAAGLIAAGKVVTDTILPKITF